MSEVIGKLQTIMPQLIDGMAEGEKDRPKILLCARDMVLNFFLSHLNVGVK